MSDLERDPEFEAFLKRRSPMHRRLSDFDHAEPSTELDRLVLNRAREAIESPPQAPIYRATRWAMPMGLAATILIAFTVVLNIDHADVKVAKQVTSDATTVSAPAPSAELARTGSAPAQSRDTAAELSESTAAGSARSTALADVADSPVSPQTQAAESRAKKAEAPPLLASANANVARAMPPPRPDAQRATGGAAGSSPQAPSSPPGDVHATAESWLREISRLRAAGKTAEADRELTAFREAYPSHPGYSLARPPTR